MENSATLSNTMYDILKVMGKDAEFLYDTIDTYIEDAENANNKELANTWRKIKSDRLNHVNLLKDALEKEIHSG
jgi:rubrerythrin